MARAGTVFLIAVLSLGLSACAPPIKDFAGEPPKDLRVDLVQISHDVDFEAGKADFRSPAARALDAFIARMGLDEDDRIFVIGRDPDSPAEPARLRAITGHLAQFDVLAHAVAPPPGVVRKTGAVSVVVERYVLVPPDCPDWTQPRGGNAENAPLSNFGCADKINLGLMVADKRDLVVGRTLGPADGELMARSIKLYREGKTKPLLLDDISTVSPSQQQQGGGTPAP